VNTITAALGQEVGISTVVEAAQRCGITSPLEQNPALALGTADVTPIEMATAYSAFASGGYRVYAYYVTEVDDHGGHPLYRRNPPPPQRVIASHVDRDLTEMLYGVVTEGTGRAAALAGHEAAGKTGTTQDYRDAWFVGFTTDYVTAVWVGNDDSSPMRNVTGGTLPAQIWHDVMSYAEKGLPSKPLDKSPPQPATDVTSLDQSMGVDTESGGENDNGSVNEPSGTSDDQSSDQSDQSGNSDSDRNRPGFFDWLFGQRDEERRKQQQQQQQQQPPSYDQQQRPPTLIRPPGSPAAPPDPNDDEQQRPPGNNDGNDN
jgi:penicillin-binding protein 1A